jgi:hypothetical protein
VSTLQELESKEKKISTKGVDGWILKHWATLECTMCSPSESGYVCAPSLLAASSAGYSSSVTRVKGVRGGRDYVWLSDIDTTGRIIFTTAEKKILENTFQIS